MVLSLVGSAWSWHELIPLVDLRTYSRRHGEVGGEAHIGRGGGRFRELEDFVVVVSDALLEVAVWEEEAWGELLARQGGECGMDSVEDRLDGTAFV